MKQFLKNMKLILLLISFNFTFSQSQSHLVIDKLNHQPVPFAEIKLFRNDSTNAVMYSNNSGILLIKNISTLNKIKISTPGYELKTLKFDEIKDTIFIYKKSEELKEVVIKPSSKENYELGYYKESKKIKISSAKGLEIVVYIENNLKKENIIKSFLCKIIKSKSYTSAVRIHFYNKVPEKDYPNEEITKENIIVYVKGNSNKNLEIDLTKYNMFLPVEGIFIGLEWLGEFDEENNSFIDSQNFETKIELNDSFKQSISFTRNHLNNRTWGNLCEDLKKFANASSTKCLNASFGIKVYKD